MAFSHVFLSYLEILSAPEDNPRITISRKWSDAGDYTSTDHFLVEYGRKLDEFRNMLSNSNNVEGQGKNSLAGLKLVDAVLRLGIEYHFNGEIEAILQREHLIFNNGINRGHNYVDQDLLEVALRFRLLRQGGYDVSADVFNKFKDTDRKFNITLVEDMEGLMAMFEASQISLEGEHILEEAEDFSRHHLKAWSNTHLEDNIRARTNVRNTLEQPYHKSLARLTATNFLNSFEGTYEEHWMTVLQEVAREDFKIVQSIHKKEIAKISRWWKELGLAEQLKFARNQPLKWYLWTVATLTDPTLSEQRIELTKPISLVYIIDDIFDVYGTLDELTLFTDAVNKWEITFAEQLPDYLKICFKALYDITNEISYKVYQKHGWNPISSLKKGWAKLCNAFLVEAQWLVSGNLPDEEEYMKNAIVSSGVHVVLVHMFFLLGQGITPEAVDELDRMPGLVSSTAAILRLWDDLGNAKDENQSGHDGSYMECYMKNHVDCSVEEARENVINMIKTEWKRLNKECLRAKPFPLCFKMACLDAARMVPKMYDYDENQRLPGLEDYMKSLLS